ncbi:hypothetical protein HDU96_006528 [Phlyctochytrium bullatum]|nr:hypothetical protein HDU96_006528 [Phlyctochytrium bullatum]
MSKVLDNVPLSSYEDEDRFRDIVNTAVKDGEVPEFKTFFKKDKAATERRRKAAEAEAREAEEAKKNRRTEQEDLASLREKMLTRRKGAFDSMIAKLEAEEAARRQKKRKSGKEQEDSSHEVENVMPSEEEFQRIQAGLLKKSSQNGKDSTASKPKVSRKRR